MSVTLDDVRLARKRAYDRVDYWLQKYRGLTIHEAGISIPRIPKNLHPSEYGEWYDYFEGLEGATAEGNTSGFVSGAYKPPDDPNEPTRSGYSTIEDTPPNFKDYYQQAIDNAYETDDVIGAIVEDALSHIGSTTDDDSNEDESEEDAWDDDDWWDYGDYEDYDTAPDYVDYEAAVIDNAYGINSVAGQAVEEALQNIKEQFENIGDMEKYQSGLEDLFDDVYFWDNLQRTNKYRRQDGNIDNRGKTEEKIFSEMNRALSKVYRHFGMHYYREY